MYVNCIKESCLVVRNEREREREMIWKKSEAHGNIQTQEEDEEK